MSPDIPPEAEIWLNEVRGRLGALDPSSREEIVHRLRGHIVESLRADDSVDGALVQFGTPRQAAERILDEQSWATGNNLHGYRMGAKRIAQFMALALVLAGVLALLVLPSYVSVTEDSTGHQSVEALPFLTVMGAGYLALLVIPVIIAAAPLLFRWRGWPVASIASAILLAAFAVVASLSIGVFFLPGTFAAIVAASLPPRSRRAIKGAVEV